MQRAWKTKKQTATLISEMPAVYISYAWGTAGKKKKRLLMTCMLHLQKRLQTYKDKIDLGYKGDIGKFMDLIGTGAYVIVVISDK